MTTFLEFKNLELEINGNGTTFNNWMLFFDEVTEQEPVNFRVDFVTEFNVNTGKLEPVALNSKSAIAIKMFFANTENAHRILNGFFIKQGITTLERTDWSAWKVRETKDLF